MNFDLDTPLLVFDSGREKVVWTIRNAVEGVQIFGGIGSGKTSGSGYFIAHKYILHGFGGLVLTAKPDEKDAWIEYCTKAGRLDDLVIVEPKGEHAFNFLEYESSKDSGLSFAENITHLLKTIIRARDEKNDGKNDDKFWQESLDRVLACTVDLCLIAYGKVTVQLLYDIVQSIMDDSEDSAFAKAMNRATDNIGEKMRQWAIRNGEACLESFDEEERNMILLQDIPALTASYLKQSRDQGETLVIADAARQAREDTLERIGQTYLAGLHNESYNRALFAEVPEAPRRDLLLQFFFEKLSPPCG